MPDLYTLVVAYWPPSRRVTLFNEQEHEPGQRLQIIVGHDELYQTLRLGHWLELRLGPGAFAPVRRCFFLDYKPYQGTESVGTVYVGPLLSSPPVANEKSTAT